VRSFDAKVKQLKKMRVLMALDAVVGICVMGLCMAVPTEVSKLILSFVGTYEGKEFLKMLIQDRGQMSEQRLSDFYVPWLCTRKTRR
jgi:hypothetical protein